MNAQKYYYAPFFIPSKNCSERYSVTILLYRFFFFCIVELFYLLCLSKLAGDGNARQRQLVCHVMNMQSFVGLIMHKNRLRI